MEPVTHILTGACLARAGFNRKVAYATLAMAVAAELPDVDTVWSLRGPVEGFAHHRGITHTFLGLPLEAAVVVGAVYGLHRWRVSRAKKVLASPDRVQRPLTKAPVRWGFLYGSVLLALLSHLLLDYTNNYGLRPFFPFNTHWFAASITFIFDPLMFVLLLVPLVLPSLLGMVSAEVGAKRKPFRGRGLSIAALVCIVFLWGLRFTERQSAVLLAMQQTYELEQQPTEVSVARPSASVLPTDAVGSATPADQSTTPATVPVPETELVQGTGQLLRVQRVEASPDPLNPFHWSVAMDFGRLYQLADVDTMAQDVTPSELTYPKLTADAAVRAAQESPLGRAYLDWSRMPILTEEEAAPAGLVKTRPLRKMTFRDPRFMGDVALLRKAGATPLMGVVTVDDSGQVVRQTLGGSREPAGHGSVREVNWQPSLAALWMKATTSQPKPAVKKIVAADVAAVKPVPVQPIVVPSVAKEPVVAAAPVVAPPPVQPVVVQPVKPEPAKVEPPKPVIVVAPKTVEAPKPAATVAPPVTVTPVAAPAPPVAKVVAPQPKVVPKPVIVEPKKAEPVKSGPGVFDGASTKVSQQYHRFRNWLNWLTNTK
jgi:inner membrane protein